MTDRKDSRNQDKLVVLNVGVSLLAESLEQQGADVIKTAWKPAKKVASDVNSLLSKII